MWWALFGLAVAMEPCVGPMEPLIASAEGFGAVRDPWGARLVALGPSPCEVALPETTAEALALVEAVARRPGAQRRSATPLGPARKDREGWREAFEGRAVGRRSEGVVLGATALLIEDRWSGAEQCVSESRFTIWSRTPGGWTPIGSQRLAFPRRLVCVAPYEPSVSLTCSVPWDHSLFYDECSPLRCGEGEVAVGYHERLLCVRARDCRPVP